VRHPALIPAISVIAGAIPGCLLPWFPPWPPLALLIALYVASLVAFLRRAPRCQFALSAAAFAVAAFVLASRVSLGALHPPLEQAVRAGGHDILALEGVLRQDASPSGNGVSLSLDVTAIAASGRRIETSGGVIAGVSGEMARGRIREWTAGREIRATGLLREPGTFRDPGVPDREVALARRGTRFIGSVKSGALVEVVSAASWFDEHAAAARQFARDTIDRAVGRWSRESAAIVIAILIGDRVGLDDEVQRRLQEAGTYHVIAISGGNIAILAGLLLGALRLARLTSRAALVAAILLLVAYARLVGGGPSVTRATLMAGMYLLAQVGDHRSPPLNALAVAGGLIVVATPLSVLDPAFALTFGATLGILVGASRLRSSVPRSIWLRAPSALFIASLSAEVALLPVAAASFSRVTFAGLVLNFFAIPLMSLAEVAGMATLALAPVSATLASWAGFLAHVGAAGLVRTAAFVDFAPWLVFRVPPPSWAATICYYAGWGLWLLLPGLPADEALPRRRAWLRAGAWCAIVGSAAWIVVSPVGRIRGAIGDGRLHVTFIDVGQADSILVRFPDARTMLVDTDGSMTGSFDVGSRVILPVLWAHDVYALDVLALSHGDPDHAGGAAAILRDFRVREVWEGVPVPRDPLLTAAGEQARRRGVAWHTRTAGERFTIGGVTVRVWHPPPPDWERQKVRNDDSIVLELRFKDVSVWLPGDIGRDVERVLAPQLESAPLAILKVPHHGSVSSSSPELLRAIRPAIAILTVGSGRPNGTLEPVLARYRQFNTAVFRSDEDGAVEVETDGTVVEVKTFGGRVMRFSARNREPPPP
jgi:competence protein ComEC